MKIHGIPATNAHQLNPHQWVNVWQYSYHSKLEFYTDCQIKDLNHYVDFEEHDIEQFVLEPIPAPAADLWQALNEEQLQKIANACIARGEAVTARVVEPAVHLDADGNEIPWCHDHDERVMTDGYCFTCLREQNL